MENPNCENGPDYPDDSEVGPAAICSLLVSDLIETLRSQAEEIRMEDIPGWGNTMEFAADTLEKYVKAMDAIYNHNAATRAAVIQHFGLWHHTANETAQTPPDSGTKNHE